MRRGDSSEGWALGQAASLCSDPPACLPDVGASSEVLAEEAELLYAPGLPFPRRSGCWECSGRAAAACSWSWMLFMLLPVRSRSVLLLPFYFILLFFFIRAERFPWSSDLLGCKT